MAWDGMGAFVRALEERSELVRIRRRVDPHLEVAAIADRVMKSGGPALLFENVGGRLVPAPHQRVRLAAAHGARPRRRRPRGARPGHRRARADARHPSNARALAELALKLPELAHVPPRSVTTRPCQDVVRTGDDVDLDALPDPDVLAEGRRARSSRFRR